MKCIEYPAAGPALPRAILKNRGIIAAMEHANFEERKDVFLQDVPSFARRDTPGKGRSAENSVNLRHTMRGDDRNPSAPLDFPKQRDGVRMVLVILDSIRDHDIRIKVDVH